MGKPVGSFWKRVNKKGEDVVSGYVYPGVRKFHLSANKFKTDSPEDAAKPDFVAWPDEEVNPYQQSHKTAPAVPAEPAQTEVPF